MDRKPKSELIAGIKDSLREFEVPYDHREWIHFQQRRKQRQRKTVPLFVKLAGIAASLFLMVYASVKLLPLISQDEVLRPAKPALTLQRPPNPVDPKQDLIDSIVPSVGAAERSSGQPYERQSKQEDKQPRAISEIANLRQFKFDRVQDVPLSTDSIGMAINKELAEKKQVTLTKPGSSLVIEDPSLRKGLGIAPDFRNINAGVQLNPLFTDRGFALGGGLSASIALSRRISIEVGANYSKLSVGQDREADTNDTVSQQIVSTSHAVGMVSVPISMNYALSESFSASVGIMPFKAVSDLRTDILQSYRWIPGDIASGDTTGRLISEQHEWRRSDSLYKNNTYLGFIYLSGYISPPLLRRYNMVIAPYVGIPVGTLRSDRYRWLHGGVSLRMYLR